MRGERYKANFAWAWERAKGITIPFKYFHKHIFIEEDRKVNLKVTFIFQKRKIQKQRKLFQL